MPLPATYKAAVTGGWMDAIDGRWIEIEIVIDKGIVIPTSKTKATPNKPSTDQTAVWRLHRVPRAWCAIWGLQWGARRYL